VTFIETAFPVTAVAFSPAGNELYSGGIDNDIKVWDLRKQTVLYSMKGHTDTITSLQVSPDGQSLLSNAHDSTVRTWNIQPFAPTDRHMKTYDGAQSGMEKNLLKASWDVDGKRIAAGSGNGTVSFLCS
jgi:Prp8 binding protein